MTNNREPWEEALRQGLDTISDMGTEEPPNVADLQMLVARVQAEQRRTTLRDLTLFWTCALLLLTVGLYVSSREPVYFLALQGVATLALLVAAGLHLTRRKQVIQ